MTQYVAGADVHVNQVRLPGRSPSRVGITHGDSTQCPSATAARRVDVNAPQGFDLCVVGWVDQWVIHSVQRLRTMM
jgi:hypothetical protein